MNKKLLLATVLAAAITADGLAQRNLSQGIQPVKLAPIVTGTNIPETLAGLTDGDEEGNVYLMQEPSEEGAPIQAFSLDLGAEYPLGMIRIVWEGACAKTFAIYAGKDGTNWDTETICKIEGQGLTHLNTLKPEKETSARYIKFEATEALNYDWGVKMREFQIFQAEDAKVTKIVPSKSFVMKDQPTTLTFSASNQFGATFEDKLTYTADNATIEDGKLTAHKAGSCLITATDEKGNKATAAVYALDETMAPPVPATAKENAYGIYGSTYASDKFAHWMTWTGTDLTLEEMALGSQVAKVFRNGSKIVVGQKANESDQGDLWMNFDNGTARYTHLSMDVFPTRDFTGTLSVEGTPNVEKAVQLKAGKWNTIELAGIAGEGNTIKCIAIATDNDGFAPMLISNIYLYKLATNQIVIAKTADAKGFYAVSGHITRANAGDLKTSSDVNVTAYDLSTSTIDDDVTAIRFANPNAVLLVDKSQPFDFTKADKLTDTNNPIVTNGNWFYSPKTLVFDDRYPIFTNQSIDVNQGKTSKGYKYTRDIEGGAWISTCLPVATALPGQVKAYEMDADHTTATEVAFKEVFTLDANKPYILHNTATASVTLEMTGEGGDFNLTANSSPSPISAGSVTFNGNYIAKNGTGHEYALQNENGNDGKLTLRQVTEQATIGTFRAFFTLNGSQESKDITFNFKDKETTGVRDLRTADAGKRGAVYSINGTLVGKDAASPGNLPKGVYIVNGRKYIVK